MNSIAKTLELQQQSNLLARLMGLVRYRKPFITRALPIVMSLVALSEANEINGKLGFAEIAAAEVNLKPATKIIWLTVGKGYRSGVREPLQVTARSQSEWNTIWRKHASVESSSPPPPAIDFDKEIVVGVFLGEKPTGGYDTTIVRAEQSNDELVIYYQEKAPAPGNMLVQAFMQPFHIVRVDKEVSAKVTFRRES